MNAIRPSCNETKDPDFSGFKFFVEYPDTFDVADYCAAYGIKNVDEIDRNDVANAQAAATNLCSGAWLEVSHDASLYTDA